MAPFLTPDPGDPGEERVGSSSVGGTQALLELRLIRDGHQVIVRGSLICPGCDLPLSPPLPRVGAGEELGCSYCDHHAPARDFVRGLVRDTAANRVALVARLA